MLYFLEVFTQVVITFKYEASSMIAPFQLSFIFYHVNDSPFVPPLPDVVVYLLSAHNNANENQEQHWPPSSYGAI
jgi:hypothetical protein